MFNGLFDVNVVVKLFAFVFACLRRLFFISDMLALPNACALLLFFFFFASCSLSLVIYIRHDEKLVTLVILFDLRPVGGILPSVWARQ